MDVYSTQNVNRKNHVADVTIDYIERQLGEISDSLSQTEDNLQQFRSSKHLLARRRRRWPALISVRSKQTRRFWHKVPRT